MNNRRGFLKMLPLAAVTATAVKIDGVAAQALELRSDRKYIVVVPGLLCSEEGQQMSKILRERIGPGVVLIGGDSVDLKVYELQ
jgi:hypothetical protein